MALQIEYDKYRLIGTPGLVLSDVTNVVLTGVNDGLATAVKTLTPADPGGVADIDYSFRINGVSLTVTSEGGDGVAEMVAKIVAAIQGDAVASAPASVVDGGTVATLTGRTLNTDFDLVSLSSNLAAATTTAAGAGSPIGFGKAVTLPSARSAGTLSDSLIARQLDLTPAAVNSAVYLVTVHVDGQGYSAQFTADGSATAAEIVDGLVLILNGILPANSVLAANDSDNLRLTAEVAGKGFSVDTGSSDAAATWTVAADNDSPLADINRALAGVVGTSKRHELPDGQARFSPPGYGNLASGGVSAGYDANVLARGAVIMELEGAGYSIMPSSEVWIGVSAAEDSKVAPSLPSGKESEYVKVDPRVAKFVFGNQGELAYVRINAF